MEFKELKKKKKKQDLCFEFGCAFDSAVTPSTHSAGKFIPVLSGSMEPLEGEMLRPKVNTSNFQRALKSPPEGSLSQIWDNSGLRIHQCEFVLPSLNAHANVFWTVSPNPSTDSAPTSQLLFILPFDAPICEASLQSLLAACI